MERNSSQDMLGLTLFYSTSPVACTGTSSDAVPASPTKHLPDSSNDSHVSTSVCNGEAAATPTTSPQVSARDVSELNCADADSKPTKISSSPENLSTGRNEDETNNFVDKTESNSDHQETVINNVYYPILLFILRYILICIYINKYLYLCLHTNFSVILNSKNKIVTQSSIRKWL